MPTDQLEVDLTTHTATANMPNLVDRLALDSYVEGPYKVFTEGFHLRRGSCCGSGCRHCPFQPRGCKNARTVRADLYNEV